MLVLALGLGLRVGGLLALETRSDRISTSTDEYFSVSSVLFTNIAQQKDAGGAMNVVGKGKLAILSCHFVGMQSGQTGGAIYSKKERVTIEDCVFERCYSPGYGGSIDLDECNLELYDSQFIESRGNSIGGALRVQAPGAGQAKLVKIERCDFTKCSGGKDGEPGGIVYVMYASAESTFINNTFTECTVNSNCGCVWDVRTSKEVSITGCQFIQCKNYVVQFFDFDESSTNAPSLRYTSCVFSHMSGPIGAITPKKATTLEDCRIEYCTGTTDVVVLPDLQSDHGHVVSGCYFTANVCNSGSQSLKVVVSKASFTIKGCVFSDHTGNLPIVAISTTSQDRALTVTDCVFKDSSVGANGVFTYTAQGGLYKFEGAVFRNLVSLAESNHILQFADSSNVQFDGCNFEASQVSGYLVTLDSGTCTLNNCNFTSCETVYGVFRATKTVNALTLSKCFVNDFTVFSALGVLNVTSGKLSLDDCGFANCVNRLRGGPLVHVSAANSSFKRVTLWFEPNARASAIQIVSGGETEFDTCAFTLEGESSEAPLIQYTGSSKVTFKSCCFAHTGKTLTQTGSAVYLGITSARSVDFTGCCFDLEKEKSISSTVPPTYNTPGEQAMFVECDAWCKQVPEPEPEPVGPDEKPDDPQDPDDKPDTGRTSTPAVVPPEGNPDSGKATAKNELGGMIAGILIGILLLIAAILLVLFLVWRKRKKNDEPTTENQEMSEETVTASTTTQDNPGDYETGDNPLFASEVSEEFGHHFEEQLPWNK